MSNYRAIATDAALYLDQSPPNRIEAIKALRRANIEGFGLKESKDVVDNAPPRAPYYDVFRDHVNYFEQALLSAADKVNYRRMSEPKYVTLVSTVTHVKITLPVYNGSYSLTVEQARTLRDQLNALDLGVPTNGGN